MAKPKVRVHRTATVGLDAVTVESITEMVELVGAPMTATITTGGGVHQSADPEGGYFSFSVTFSWEEEK